MAVKFKFWQKDSRTLELEEKSKYGIMEYLIQMGPCKVNESLPMYFPYPFCSILSV